MMFYINQNTQMRCTNFFCWLTSNMGPISVARGAGLRCAAAFSEQLHY